MKIIRGHAITYENAEKVGGFHFFQNDEIHNNKLVLRDDKATRKKIEQNRCCRPLILLIFTSHFLHFVKS